jgi:hypothetical protein
MLAQRNSKLLRKKFLDCPWAVWGRANEDMLRLTDHGADDIMAAVEIEIESEGVCINTARSILDNTPQNKWRVVSEGSLRNNGFELVSLRPLPKEVLKLSLAQAYPMLDDIVDTFRAAIHVHVNMQWATRLQYARTLIAYWLLEPTIYEFVGDGRDESVFCVPWSKGSAHIHNIMKAFHTSNGPAWNRAIAHSPKYSGLNMKATHRYGSLEFRHLQTPALAPVDTLARIGDYVDTCCGVIEIAAAYDKDDDDLLKFADWVLEESGESVPPEHVCSVYSALAGAKPVDRMECGIPTSQLIKVVDIHSPPRRRLRGAGLQGLRRVDLEMADEPAHDIDLAAAADFDTVAPARISMSEMVERVSRQSTTWYDDAPE